jgi:hypothetical protein
VNVVVEAIEKYKREKKDFKRQGAKKKEGQEHVQSKALKSWKECVSPAQNLHAGKGGNGEARLDESDSKGPWWWVNQGGAPVTVVPFPGPYGLLHSLALIDIISDTLFRPTGTQHCQMTFR